MRFAVPETIQTSAVDCGPAALKSLLEGFGIAASYGRLREACQTGLDGTSIDTVEIVARELGLDAEQVMLPPDYLALDETALPAVVVVRQPSGYTHFVVVWRKAGPFFQIMDPATGRHWVRCRDFLARVYVHEHRVGAADWRAWAASPEAAAMLRRRIAAVADDKFAARVVEEACSAPGWMPLARLDAAARLTAALVRSGAVARRKAAPVLAALIAGDEEIPPAYWPVRAAENGGDVILRGAVLIRVRGAKNAAGGRTALGAAVRERRVHPLRRMLAFLGPSTRAALPLATLGWIVAGAAAVAEGLLFRSLLDLVTDAGLPQERVLLLGAFAAFAAVLLALDYRLTERSGIWGRELEARLSAAVFTRLAALRSDYFGSRVVSDLAERSHAIAELRPLPYILGRTLRSGASFVVTAAALAWLVPSSALLAAAGAAVLLALAFLFEPLFAETDLRARTHAGGLTRFYLDALKGLTTVHAHCAERSVAREHEALLVDWARASRRQNDAAIASQSILALAGFAIATLLLRRYLGSAADPGGVLLVAYWALNLPLFAADIALGLQVYATLRSVMLRVLEPLDAPQELAPDDVLPELGSAAGVAIEFRRASFVATGHAILSDVDLSIASGEFVGIVGASGAGKSTLVGALLGWMMPSEGDVAVDGAPLTPARIAALRRTTAWVEPGVQLFNAPLDENILYAAGPAGAARLPSALSDAELYEVLQRISDSRLPLGESGALLSGGEGQRVRLARALLQRARLIILDEAFRGLDRPLRHELLQRCRRLWSGATMLFVTHDLEETAACDRVLVLEEGRVVENGAPEALLARTGSKYDAMRAAAEAARGAVWASADWRRLELRDGRLQ